MAKFVGSEIGHDGKRMTISKKKQKVLESDQPGKTLDAANKFPEVVEEGIRQNIEVDRD